MSQHEIKGLFSWTKNHWLPRGLNIREKLWWRFMPGVIIKVKWPAGNITVDESDPRWDWSLGASLQGGVSADPNDHYRPWLEQHVGRQGWDWDWGISITKNDAADNTLTIKIRQRHARHATIAALRWS